MTNVLYDLVLVGVGGSVISGLIVGIILKISWKIFFFKLRLRKILDNYIRNSTNEEKERKYILKLGKLIDKALKKVNKLERLGFQPFGNRGIGNDEFRLYFKIGFKFTIKDLKNSQAFFSINFEEGTLKKSIDGAEQNI